MNKNLTLKLVIITGLCFGASYVFSVMGGLNRDLPYPFSILKVYGERNEALRQVHLEKVLTFEKNSNSLLLRTISTDLQVVLSPDEKVHIKLEGSFPVAQDEAALVVVQNGTQIEIRTEELDSEDSFKKDFVKVSLQKRLLLELPRSALDHFANITLETVSGALVFKANTLGYLALKTVSGKMKVEGQVEELKIQTVSGEAEIALSRPFASFHFNSVSGDLRLHLPAATNPELNFNSVSGKIEIADSVKASSKKQGVLNAKTISGSIRILEN